MLRYRCDRPPASQRAPRSALPSARSANIAQEARGAIHLWFTPRQDNGQYAALFFKKPAYGLPDVFSRSFRLDSKLGGRKRIGRLGWRSILRIRKRKASTNPRGERSSDSGGVPRQGKPGFRPLASGLPRASARSAEPHTKVPVPLDSIARVHRRSPEGSF